MHIKWMAKGGGIRVHVVITVAPEGSCVSCDSAKSSAHHRHGMSDKVLQAE